MATFQEFGYRTYGNDENILKVIDFADFLNWETNEELETEIEKFKNSGNPISVDCSYNDRVGKIHLSISGLGWCYGDGWFEDQDDFENVYNILKPIQ